MTPWLSYFLSGLFALFGFNIYTKISTGGGWFLNVLIDRSPNSALLCLVCFGVSAIVLAIAMRSGNQ